MNEFDIPHDQLCRAKQLERHHQAAMIRRCIKAYNEIDVQMGPHTKRLISLMDRYYMREFGFSICKSE
jgi:ribosome biogenesis protein Tsr3